MLHSLDLTSYFQRDGTQELGLWIWGESRYTVSNLGDLLRFGLSLQFLKNWKTISQLLICHIKYVMWLMLQLILNRKGQKVNYGLYFMHQHMVSIAILIDNSNKHGCLDWNFISKSWNVRTKTALFTWNRKIKQHIEANLNVNVRNRKETMVN